MCQHTCTRHQTLGEIISKSDIPNGCKRRTNNKTRSRKWGTNSNKLFLNAVNSVMKVDSNALFVPSVCSLHNLDKYVLVIIRGSRQAADTLVGKYWHYESISMFLERTRVIKFEYEGRGLLPKNCSRLYEGFSRENSKFSVISSFFLLLNSRISK